MAAKPAKVGVIGCGNICGAYLKANETFEMVDIVACADLVMDRAEAAARQHNIPRACSVEDLLADPEIEIVVNLTIPKAHAEINLAALKAGKCVHTEKPFAVTRADGKSVLQAAGDKGLLVGGAPDTFMGPGLQNCRKLIDDGAIGEPVAATAFMLCRGHESWHPNPGFFYEPGGGPMFDMGPYYLTALISLLGPVKRVCGSARISFPERTISAEKNKGKKITVTTPTHIAGVMDFASGAVVTIITSFDVCAHRLPHIEIYGSEGTIQVPDPNGFWGSIFLQRAGEEQKEMPLVDNFGSGHRGIGVADMACALRSGRPHRANGKMAYHVLDVMQSFNDASENSAYVHLESTCDRPAALPLGLAPGQLDP